MNDNTVKCLVCGSDTEYDIDCPVCGWEMDSGMTTDDGEEIGPPNYFKASDYRKFWELSGENRSRMAKWRDFMAIEAKDNPEYWKTADDDRLSEIYDGMIRNLEKEIESTK
ncbi:hypothetical protein IKQ19_00685 [Candidatus Saccharibacteria bacterium]|nr:hypothetical protein [Candidatus Saccharibacteria bacterium]